MPRIIIDLALSRLHEIIEKPEGATATEIISIAAEVDRLRRSSAVVPMRLRCPSCNELHIDESEFATKPHHTHACQHCGEVWRPAIVPTVGVKFLPGFKNE
jgi:predicted RNA-binding Zn-ribbon protein involved in translation (DUF1610 family)